ncbi:YfhD family protein [Jeotgalibacillus marinus]|uniref:YfhD family protein n=1 Tax=Jeotgalibacillus marinus TaxID=86667 RepID=A0ABV3Q4C7_9BACL
MGRANKHRATSNNKNSLPQTPKGLKIAPENVNEEFSRELAAHGDIISKREMNKRPKK